MSDGYNYRHFDRYVHDGREEADHAAFPERLHVGRAAPNAALRRLDDGGSVTLSSLWADRFAVLEFGSFT